MAEKDATVSAPAPEPQLPTPEPPAPTDPSDPVAVMRQIIAERNARRDAAEPTIGLAPPEAPTEGDAAEEGEPEPPAPTPEPPKAEEPPIASHLAKLAEAERQAQRRIQARWQKEFQEVEKQKAELAAWRSAVEKFKEDPAAGLNALSDLTGEDLSYQGMTKRALSGKALPESPELRELRKRIEQEQESRKALEQRIAQSEQSREAAEYKGRAVAAFGSEEKHPYIAAMASEENADPVQWVIEQTWRHYERTGEALTPEQACERLEAQLGRVAQRSQIKASKAPPATAETKQGNADETPATGQRKPAKAPATLTNKMTSSVGSVDLDTDISDEATQRRAVAHMRKLGWK